MPEHPDSPSTSVVPDKFLLYLVGIMVALVVLLLSFNLYFQYWTYSRAIGLALGTDTPGLVDHGIVLSYSRAWDFAVVKTSALFLAFALIFVGALYVLRTVETSYSLSVTGGDAKAALATSSPGLVMVTLGVSIVLFVLVTKTSVTYDSVPIAEAQETSFLDTPAQPVE